MNTAIIFLCKVPHENTLRFAQEIRDKSGMEVIIISDEEFTGNGVVNISDKLCWDNGYVNSNISDSATHIKKNPIAWDKAILFLCEIAHHIDFAWIIEDDCFVPSVDTLVNLTEKYSEYDLVTGNNHCNRNKKAQDWHWRSIYDKTEPPYYYSMVCAMGVSRYLLSHIKQYVARNGSLFYIEVMFNTIAMQNNISVATAKELKSIVWIGEWDIDEFLLLPDNIFHPRKDIENHPSLRQEIDQAKNEGYVPFNRLPEFLL